MTASYQYCFTLNGAYQGCTTVVPILLLHYDSFHADDIIDYMGTQGQLPPGASDASFGTFFVTFSGLPSSNGWEGTLTGRTYNAADNSDPSKGTVAIAYLGSNFFESAQGTIQAIIRDTVPAPTDAGSLRTNIGVTNTGLTTTRNVPHLLDHFLQHRHRAGRGQRADSPRSSRRGRWFNDVFTAAHIPTDVTSSSRSSTSRAPGRTGRSRVRQRPRRRHQRRGVLRFMFRGVPELRAETEGKGDAAKPAEGALEPGRGFLAALGMTTPPTSAASSYAAGPHASGGDVAPHVFSLELDPVGGLVGAFPGLGHRGRRGRHDEHASPGRHKTVAVAGGPRVEQLDPGKAHRLGQAGDRAPSLVVPG